MAINPCGLQVPGPALLPSRYGLLSVATPQTPADGHWEGGVTWDNDFCTSIHSTSQECPPASVEKERDRDWEFCCADPFVVYGTYDCPPVGRAAQDAFRIATDRLRLREGQEVERVFWTGLTQQGDSVNPSLAFGNSECGAAPEDLTPGTLMSPQASLATLESALAGCIPGGGVIHANYGLAPYFTSGHMLYQEDNTWYTATGSRVAFGAGYPGSGPDNEAADAGTSWMFATGPIGIWRSEIFLTPERLDQAVDRNINDVTVYAERTYAVGWACCVFAIQVELCSNC